MIRSEIRFGDGLWVDLFDKFGFVHLESDNRVGAPMKAYETTTYAEEHGEHIYPYTVYDAFDYKVTFLVVAASGAADAKITAFNDSLFESVAGSDLKKASRISFYNAYDNTIIVGYPNPISETSYFYRDPNGRLRDTIKVEMTIRVDNPSLCQWHAFSPSSARLIISQDGQSFSFNNVMNELAASGTLYLARWTSKSKYRKACVFKKQSIAPKDYMYYQRGKYKRLSSEVGIAAANSTPTPIRTVAQAMTLMGGMIETTQASENEWEISTARGRKHIVRASLDKHHRAYIKFAFVTNPTYNDHTLSTVLPNAMFKYNIDYQGNTWLSL